MTRNSIVHQVLPLTRNGKRHGSPLSFPLVLWDFMAHRDRAMSIGVRQIDACDYITTVRKETGWILGLEYIYGFIDLLFHALHPPAIL